MESFDAEQTVEKKGGMGLARITHTRQAYQNIKPALKHEYSKYDSCSIVMWFFIAKDFCYH